MDHMIWAISLILVYYILHTAELSKGTFYFYVIPIRHLLLITIWLFGKSMGIMNMRKIIVGTKIQRLVTMSDSQIWRFDRVTQVVWYNLCSTTKVPVCTGVSFLVRKRLWRRCLTCWRPLFSPDFDESNFHYSSRITWQNRFLVRISIN